MGSETGISWSDRTKSMWHGCEHAPLEDGTTHPGCDNCYAEIGANQNPGILGVWGPDGTRVPSKSFEKECDKWQKEARAAKTVFTVFPSIHDPFEDREDLVEPRHKMFEVIDRCPNLIFLLLTKRPGNIVRLWPERAVDVNYRHRSGGSHAEPNPLPHTTQVVEHTPVRSNVYLGTSISNQKTSDEMIRKLVKASHLTPLLFLSAGPLLGEIDLTHLDSGNGNFYNALNGEVTIERRGEDDHKFRASDTKPIGWVITEGESTAHARPCNPDHVRSLRQQCELFGTPFHHKQWGEWLPYENGDGSLWVSQRGDSIDCHELPDDLGDCEPVGEWYAPILDGFIYRKVGKNAAGAFLDGNLYQAFPELLLKAKAGK